MYCRYVPPKVRQSLFEDVVSSTLLSKSKATKKELTDYFNNQIYETFGPYCEALERAAEEYLYKTDAGLYVQELYNNHINKLKGASSIARPPKAHESSLTTRSLSGGSEWTVPFDFISDFQPLTDVTQLLLFNDKVGLEFTSYQLIDINRRTLAFLELEDLGDGQVGWLSGQDNEAWMEVLATSTLMDILLFIIGRFGGEIPKKRKSTPREGLGKDSRFGESLWRNRPQIPDSITKFPAVADWDKRVELFGKRFSLSISTSAKLAGNSLHHYVLSGPDAVRVGGKHSNLKRNQEIFGDGLVEPFSRVKETGFGEAGETDDEERPDLPTDMLFEGDGSPIDKPVDDDAILDDQPNIEEIRMEDDSNYIKSTFENFRTKLNDTGVRHPFDDNENFEAMIGLFKIITTPVKEEQSKIAAIFAKSSYMGQLKLGKALAEHNQYLLAAMAAKLTEEAIAYDAKIAEYEASMSAQLNILGIIAQANEANKSKAMLLEETKKEHSRYLAARTMSDLQGSSRHAPLEIADSDTDDKQADTRMFATPSPIRGRTGSTPVFKTPMAIRHSNPPPHLARPVEDVVDQHTDVISSRYSHKHEHRGSRHSSRRVYDEPDDVAYSRTTRHRSRHSRHKTRFRSPHRDRERKRDARDRGRSRSRSRHYSRRDRSISRSRSTSRSYSDSDSGNNHSSPDSRDRARVRSRSRSISRDRTRSHHYSKGEKEHQSRQHPRDRDRKRRRELDNHSGRSHRESKKIKKGPESRGSSEYGELDADDVRVLEEEEKKRDEGVTVSTERLLDEDIVDVSMTTSEVPISGNVDSSISTPSKAALISDDATPSPTPTANTNLAGTLSEVASIPPIDEEKILGECETPVKTPSPSQHSSFVTGSMGNVSGLRVPTKDGKKPLSLAPGAGVLPVYDDKGNNSPTVID